MSELIEKQKLLNYLSEIAQSITVRGPMYGNFGEQEAIMHTLISFRDYILDKNQTLEIRDQARYKICRKYKLNSVLAFSAQVLENSDASSEEQKEFSAILKDWWECE